MKKVLVLITFMLFSFLSHAQSNCASNITDLKALVGNSGISMNWRETAKSDPLTLRLSNGGSLLRLKLTSPKGDWADVTGVVCKKNNGNYEARVSNIVWGPAAPGVVKGRKISTMTIKLPYDSLMKVSIKVLLVNFGFEFAAI